SRAAVSMASLWILLVQIGLGMSQLPNASAAAEFLGRDQLCTVEDASEASSPQSIPANLDHRSNHDCGLCSLYCAAGGHAAVDPSLPIIFMLSALVSLPVDYGDGPRADAAFFSRHHSRAPPAMV
ncbi:MAG: DUF2946 family protein, partial [Rhodospirillales bacterium]|nr:DUF2946 family protein [Rhodospirillales bacterium]